MYILSQLRHELLKDHNSIYYKTEIIASQKMHFVL